MNPPTRRRILKLTSVGITVTIAGYLGGSVDGDDSEGENDDGETWPPEITTAEPELTPDNNGILPVNISNVRGVSIDGDDVINFDREDADISPSPAGMLRTNPGRWIWEETSAVEIQVPVVVDEGARPGKYSYEVEVSAGKTQADGKSVTETFELSVTE